MKTLILIVLFTILFYDGCAQDSAYNFQYPRRFTLVVTDEKLKSVQFLNDITPDLWQQLSIPYNEYDELKYRRKTQGYYNVNTLIDYVLVEISTKHNGKVLTSQSTSDRLTVEQKRILNTADLGSEILIRIQFRYKIYADRTIEGKLAVEVVPETEAEFPGGVEKRMAYFEKNVTDKLSGLKELEKMSLAEVVFTVNEEGEIGNVTLLQTTNDAKIDKLLFDAFRKMPRWSPAKDAQGKRVKQTFRVPFGGGC